MTYYVRNGNTFSQSSSRALDIHEALPAGTYTIKLNPITGYYFEIIDDFDLPSKRYGNLNKNVDRILSTFADRSGSTGILLAGEKGSGKTLLGKTLSVELLKAKVPTIVINTNHCGEAFNTFIQQMEQPAVIFFDEFEKIYSQEEQERILTLLDGVYPTKKLFIITANDKYRIDEHMRNRPGRIFYAMDFNGLEKEFIVEYAEENLKDKAQVPSVVNVSTLFPKFNFDMLKAIVEEMNRYNETAQEAIALLNTKPETSGSQKFDISFYQDGERVPDSALEETNWIGNPLKGGICIWLDQPTLKAKQISGILMRADLPDDQRATYQDLLADEEGLSVDFTSENLVSMDGMKGTFTYVKVEDGKQYKLVLTKQTTTSYDYRVLL